MMMMYDGGGIAIDILRKYHCVKLRVNYKRVIIIYNNCLTYDATTNA